MIDNITDIIIVGSGVAGMSAALYSLRAGKKVTLLENESIGGQIASSPKVENFPTIQEISGLELSDRLYNQLKIGGEGLIKPPPPFIFYIYVLKISICNYK